MRVAIVCVAPLRSGPVLGGTYSSSLGEALAGRGIEAELWTKKTVEPYADVKVSIRQVWRPGLMAWLDIVRAVWKFKPDVLHVQYYFFLFGNGASGEISALLLALSMFLLRTRLVVTLHDVPERERMTQQYLRLHKYHYPAPLVRAGVSAVFSVFGKAAQAVIVHGDRFAQRLIEFGVPVGKIAVIPHMPLLVKRIERTAARAQLNIRNGACVILFFGYATGYKGLESLLDAFEILERRKSYVRLILGAGTRPKFGDTPEYQRYYRRLEARANSLSSVDFVGFIKPSELDTYLSAADAGILPYIEYHGASGPLYYYLAHGCPVLVSRPVAEDLPGFHAGVFESAPSAIADMIDRFAGDPALRTSIAAECSAQGDQAVSNGYLDLTREIYLQAAGAPA